MVGHRRSSAGSYLADPTSPIPSHCASIVATSTVRVKINFHPLGTHQFRVCSNSTEREACQILQTHDQRWVLQYKPDHQLPPPPLPECLLSAAPPPPHYHWQSLLSALVWVSPLGFHRHHVRKLCWGVCEQSVKLAAVPGQPAVGKDKF